MTNFAYSLLFFANIANINGQPLAQASSPSMQTATIQEIIDGREIFIQQRSAKLKDKAIQGQTITTARARAEIEFNNRAIARMGNNSRLLVGSCINLAQGNVLVSGSMPACTRTITAAVRGTTYYLEVSLDSDQNLLETISVIEGEIEVSDPTAPDKPPKRLGAGKKLRAVRGKLREQLEDMTQVEFEEIVEKIVLRGFRRKLPKHDQVARMLRTKFPRSRLLRILR